MESHLNLVLILTIVTFADHAHSQSISASENPIAVGSNVTLSSMTTVSLGIWLFNQRMVVFISPMNQTVTPLWKDRAVFNPNTSSLTINSVRLEDSGVFTLQGVTGDPADLTLSVQVPISNVTLRAKATDLVEYNDTAVLMCSVSNGTSLSYTWLKGTDTITEGGDVHFSDDGATLSMTVTRHDEGPYRCNVSNGIGSEVSGPVRLNISYGPSNVTLTIKPTKMTTYKTGSNITLSCSADSSPTATVQWMVDGVTQTDLHHKLENVTESNSGNYKCLFYNSVTLRFSSASAEIWILDPLTSVVVTQSNSAILHGSVTLRCEVNGTVDSILWKKDGHLVSADNTTSFGMSNKTLTLSSVQHSHNGHYECQAFNVVSNMTSSPHEVMVYFGPLMPVITGPHVAKTGDNVTFSCNATSRPSSHYEWYLGDTLLSSMPEYVTPPLTLNMSGKYICKAFNNITGKNSTAYKMLTVIDPIKSVHIKGPMTPVIEGHAYNLTCHVTGPPDRIYWMKDGMMLQDNSTALYTTNKTLMFMPVDRHDTGHYQCKAINAVGNMTSRPYMLLVNYGPDTPTIDGPQYAEIGRHAVFHCSAMSVPLSTYSWWYKSEGVANASMYKTDILSSNMSGEYICKAYNNITMKTSKSSKMLTVIEAIESVMVQKNSLPIHNENFTLTCVVVGPYDSIYWMKNNMTLNMNGSMMNGSMMNSSTMNGPMMNSSMMNGSMMNSSTINGSMMNSSMTNHHMSYHIVNNTLYFTPVTTHNDGAYRCVAANKAAHHKSPEYMLLVNYGPLSVMISGPHWADLGSTVSLTCSADSRPECEFSWFFSTVPVNTGPVISFPVTLQSMGDYTCKARNPVTNITMYHSRTFPSAGQDSTIYFASRSSLMMTVVFALSTLVLFN